jgi:NADPH:quinone reductase-like Zn-dependent oxidoreductase
MPPPGAGSGQAVVSVLAAGVNPVDAGNRGDPSWAGLDTPYVVGYEFAGVVASVHPDVTDLRVGVPVWGLLPVRGTRWGAYAEQIAVPVGLLAPRPAALTAQEAAAVPLAAVADLVGGNLLPSLRYVVEGGRAATIVDLAGDFDEAIDRNITIHGVLLRPGREVLDRLSAAVEAGLRPTVRQVFPLADAPAAHRRLEAGGVAGKIVLSIVD